MGGDPQNRLIPENISGVGCQKTCFFRGGVKKSGKNGVPVWEGLQKRGSTGAKVVPRGDTPRVQFIIRPLLSAPPSQMPGHDSGVIFQSPVPLPTRIAPEGQKVAKLG